jgi:DNA-binding MarR family transcriptional regulator
MSVIDPGPDRYYRDRADPTGASPGPAMVDDTPRLAALSPPSLHVLLALARGPLHGYGIMRQVEKDSGTLMSLPTIHGTLDRLEVLGWVEDAGEDAADARRGLFALTAAGREALRAQIGRVPGMARLARERGIVTPDWR